jgi:hypothetical protein
MPRSRSTAPGALAPTASRRLGPDVRLAHQDADLVGDSCQHSGRRELLRRRHHATRDGCAAQVGDRQSRLPGTEVDAHDEAVAGIEFHERRAAASA